MRPKPKKADQKLVNNWNAKHQIGTPVFFQLIKPPRCDSDIMETKTRAEAWVMGRHSPVVMVDGVAGAVHLRHITLKRPKVVTL